MMLKKTNRPARTARRLSNRRDLLQQLESRQMFAAFSSAAIDFRATYAGVESNYTADVGKAFAWQGNYQYGWNADNTSQTRNRADTGRLQSFAYLGGSAASTWEIAVPNGQYDVSVTAGDPGEASSHYGVNVEGTTVVNETPTWSDLYADGSARVTVSDGKLTVTSAAGSWNNKLDSIQITAVDASATAATPTTVTASSWGAPAAPGRSGAWSNNNSVGVNWQDASNNEQNFVIERSTDGTTFSAVGAVGTNVTYFDAGALSGWTRYFFRVKAYNSAGYSTYSPVSSVVTGNVVTTPTTTWTTPAATVTPPPAATSWSAATGGTNAVTINWANVANEQGYIVQRSTDGWNFSEITRVNADVTTYTNYGLATGTTYYYRIQSYNAGGTSNGPTASASTASAVIAAPATPGWLSGAASGTDSVNLVWGDVTNESGYIIERSTDGWTFNEITRVNQGVSSYVATGLSAGTKYIFRVKAYNAGGTSNASQNATVTTNSAWVAPTTTWTAPTTTPTSTAGINKSAVVGVVPNQISASSAIPMLQQLGSKSVRLWYSVGNWSDGVNSWDIAAAKQYKAAGFSVVMDVNSANVPDYNSAKALYTRLANSELRNYVDYWEIGNEPNMYTYWHGSLQQFVTNNMKPAYEAFHAVGEPVIGGAISWDVNACKQLQSYGYSSYCDYTGFHPYGESGNIVAQRASDAKAAFGGKPMIITEWNVQSISDPTTWAREITIAATQLSNIAVQNYYYALIVDYSHVGAGGTFYSNGTRNTPFFNAVYSWTH